MNAIEGIVFNIQRYSIDDGPGVRTTVFLKGCPLSCLWCSNPESIDPMPEVTYRYTSCKRCGTCISACPTGAITLDEAGIHIDRKNCDRCGTCVSVCMPEALKISGKKMSVEEVFKIVKKDIDYYEASGGGLTCSGGEVLSQPEFVAALFRRCREAGIHACADTSGWGSREAMETVLEYCDLVYFDLKHINAAEHKKLCGQSNDLILNNLALIAEEKVPVVLRVPLIPGCNDSKENISAIAETAARFLKDALVHILPYHRYGTNKYRMLDMEYPLEITESPIPEKLDQARKIIESFGLKCEIKN
jgi:pyruvate formate lyase activating enzyme